jgi:hypothetical protein
MKVSTTAFKMPVNFRGKLGFIVEVTNDFSFYLRTVKQRKTLAVDMLVF